MQTVHDRIDTQPVAPQHPFRALLWAILLPLCGVLVYLGLIVMLGTTSPLQATVGSSMLPTLNTGDLAVMEGIPKGGVQLGDVIAIDVGEFNRQQYGYPSHVLHRVIDVVTTDDGVMVQTKGDNQDSPDPFMTPVSEVNSRLTFHVPKLGYALFYLQSNNGKLALAGLVVLFLLYEAVRWITDTAEELIDDGEVAGPVFIGAGRPAGLDEFTGAIAEYGAHLRSHTRVVQGLGDTTVELRESAEMQREVIGELRDSVRTLASQLRPGTTASAFEAGATRPDTYAFAAIAPTRPTPGGTAVATRPATQGATAEARAPRTTFATPALAQFLARPILFATVLPWQIAPLVMHVRGFATQDELLKFGDALDNDPWSFAVSLEAIPPGAAVFALETGDPEASLERVRRMADFSVHLTPPAPTIVSPAESSAGA